MARRIPKEHLAWFEKNRESYSLLANSVAATIRTLLQNEKIDVVDVDFRAKTLLSFSEKIRRKRYSDPQIEMTDLAGIRVVTLIERDVERVSRLIQESFNVHADSSVNKSDDLGSDRFGYRSVHFVCDIGSVRSGLPEFSPYKNMCFEIQVRTALQHAWAEIEHDRSYKFSGELPSKLKRRFHLIAGLLELADREFNALTEDLENYTTEVNVQTRVGNLEIELNSTSALEFLKLTLERSPAHARVSVEKIDQDDIAELRRFGVDTVSKYAVLFGKDFLEATGNFSTSAVGLIRDAMIYADIDKYFSTAWQSAWDGWDLESYEVMVDKYGKDKLASVVQKFDLQILDPEYDFSPFD